MKTKAFYLATKITVAVILVALLVVKVSASETSNLKVTPYAPERALIELNNSGNLMSELTIENAAGDVVYYKEGKINSDFYSKKFDFTNLSNGDYKVTVDNKNGKNEVYLTVKDNKIMVKSDAGLNKPYVEIKDDVLKLSLLNNTLNDINLLVSNEEGEVLYKKSLGNNFSICAGFNLASLENGYYDIDITDGVNTYTYNYKK